MRQLKDDAERHALNQRCREVEQQYGPQRVAEQRDRQRQREEDRLAAEENREVPSFGRANSASADPAGGQVAEVVVELPLHGQKAVKRPEVKLLKPVERQSPLVRREPAENAEIDVVVVARDVRVVVMQHVVLRAQKYELPPSRSRERAMSRLIQGRSE